MRLLALNTGSSSLKFEIWSSQGGDSIWVHRGQVRLSGANAIVTLDGKEKNSPGRLGGIEDAIRVVISVLTEERLLPVDAVVHRVVHGGLDLKTSALIDESVLQKIEQATELAPLHNKPALQVIKATREAMAETPMVAVFDTTFHRQMPDKARHYSIDRNLAEKYGIQRFGFHGLAHEYMSQQWSQLAGRNLVGSKLVTLQLGSGSSAAAIADGRSVDTSMGFTPLAGLIMETRSGDIDPAIVAFLAEKEGVAATEVEAWLNQSSGLLGIAGMRDMRELLAADAVGNAAAALAVEMFVYQVQKYIGAYLVAMGGADAIVFGGGIGENAPLIRTRVIESLTWLGVRLDTARNESAIGVSQLISTDDSAMQVWAIAVDESSVMVKEAARLLSQKPGGEN